MAKSFETENEKRKKQKSERLKRKNNVFTVFFFLTESFYRTLFNRKFFFALRTENFFGKIFFLIKKEKIKKYPERKEKSAVLKIKKAVLKENFS